MVAVRPPLRAGPSRSRRPLNIWFPRKRGLLGQRSSRSEPGPVQSSPARKPFVGACLGALGRGRGARSPRGSPNDGLGSGPHSALGHRHHMTRRSRMTGSGPCHSVVPLRGTGAGDDFRPNPGSVRPTSSSVFRPPGFPTELAPETGPRPRAPPGRPAELPRGLHGLRGLQWAGCVRRVVQPSLGERRGGVSVGVGGFRSASTGGGGGRKDGPEV